MIIEDYKSIDVGGVHRSFHFTGVCQPTTSGFQLVEQIETEEGTITEEGFQGKRKATVHSENVKVEGPEEIAPEITQLLMMEKMEELAEDNAEASLEFAIKTAVAGLKEEEGQEEEEEEEEEQEQKAEVAPLPIRKRGAFRQPRPASAKHGPQKHPAFPPPKPLPQAELHKKGPFIRRQATPMPPRKLLEDEEGFDAVPRPLFMMVPPSQTGRQGETVMMYVGKPGEEEGKEEQEEEEKGGKEGEVRVRKSGEEEEMEEEALPLRMFIRKGEGAEEGQEQEEEEEEEEEGEELDEKAKERLLEALTREPPAAQPMMILIPRNQKGEAGAPIAVPLGLPAELCAGVPIASGAERAGARDSSKTEEMLASALANDPIGQRVLAEHMDKDLSTLKGMVFDLGDANEEDWVQGCEELRRNDIEPTPAVQKLLLLKMIADSQRPQAERMAEVKQQQAEARCLNELLRSVGSDIAPL
jgi:hypothetical protein